MMGKGERQRQVIRKGRPETEARKGERELQKLRMGGIEKQKLEKG